MLYVPSLFIFKFQSFMRGFGVMLNERREPNVVQQLTCCLARPLLIYIGTPMVVARLWRR
jgi:hypothetical protein